MKNKTYRFAAALAILLALALVFVAPVSADAVATLNGQSYETLQDALNKATGDATITVMPGVISEKPDLIGYDNSATPASGSGTADNPYVSPRVLNSLTLTGGSIPGFSIGASRHVIYADTTYYTIYKYDIGTLTFRDMTITDRVYISEDKKYGDAVTDIDNLVFENVIFDMSGKSEPGAVHIVSKYASIDNITIRNCKFINLDNIEKPVAIDHACENSVNITIENCEFSSNSISVLRNAIQIAGTGCNYTGSIKITDNTIINTSDRGIRVGYFAGDITVTDNTLKNAADASGEAIKINIKNGATYELDRNTLNGEPLAVSASASDVIAKVSVAKIETKGYLSLADAVEAANSGDTITLLSDVELDSRLDIANTITLDLNGYTISSSNADNYGLVYVKKDAILTIIDSGDDGSIISNTYAIGNYGTVIIDDGILSTTDDEYVALYNFYYQADYYGKATINAGTVGEIWNCGELTVVSGTISVLDNSGYTKILGGIIGSLIARNGSDAPLVTEKGTLIITGGTFNGEVTNNDGDSIITITGGTFSSNPSAYIASGYEVVQPGDKYLVQKYVDRSSSSSSSSSTTEPEEPVDPEQPEEPVVEPETPAEPVVGEPTVETEVTDGGEVIFEAPVEPETPEVGEGGEAPADEPAEPAITGVVLPQGTDSEVTFIPISEQPAPAGKETSTKKVFEINVPTYEKGKPATIKFTMTVAELEADGKTAEQVALWHFDEETGEWTKLLTSYIIVDGVVYFEAITYDFSPFAIIYEETPVDEPVEEPETPATPAPLFAVLAGLGAAVVLRRK